MARQFVEFLLDQEAKILSPLAICVFTDASLLYVNEHN